MSVLINQVEFDTIYHEHVGYWSPLAMLELVTRDNNFVLHDIQQLDVHGGSLRYTLRRDATSADVSAWSEPFLATTLETFSHRVVTCLEQLKNLLTTLSAQGKTIWVYGAAAKANNLLAMLAAQEALLPEVIIDDTPIKQGWYTSGTHLPILAPPSSLAHVDVLWLGAWNWADDLKQQARKLGFQGQFLTPLPEPRREDA